MVAEKQVIWKPTVRKVIKTKLCSGTKKDKKGKETSSMSVHIVLVSFEYPNDDSQDFGRACFLDLQYKQANVGMWMIPRVDGGEWWS